MKNEKQKRNRRYYIHRKLKGVYTVRPRRKIIEIPSGVEELPKLNLVKELIKTGYQAQYFIQ